MKTEQIKAIIEEFLKKMSVSHDSVDLLEGEEGVTRFLIKTKEPEILIGRDGITLFAINHIVRRMTESVTDAGTEAVSEINFIIDVNDYQKKKIDDLRQKAKMMADRARFFKSSVELEPMSSYERMIVHSFLEPFPDVMTESAGDGVGRHVIIRYQDNEQ